MMNAATLPTPPAALAGQPAGAQAKGHRDERGRFALGNPGGPGPKRAKEAAAIRHALLEAVERDDVRTIAAALIERAKAGDLAAAKEVLDRVLGRPVAAVDLTADVQVDAQTERVLGLVQVTRDEILAAVGQG